MSKKSIIIFVCLFVLLFVLMAMVGYFNHDQISDYFENDMWVYKEPFITDNSPDIIESFRNNNLVTYTQNGFSFYNSKGKLIKIMSINFNDFISDSEGNYFAVFAKDTNNLMLIKDTEQLWNKEIKYDIKQISVNNSGYVAICFLQNGYKSGIMVYGPSGKNILTTYLASTYATQAIVSKDNRFLYVAEVNTSGIKPQSKVRIIDIQAVEAGGKTSDFDIKEIGNDEIITDIDFSTNGELFILTDKSIYLMASSIEKLFEFDERYSLYATINDVNYPFVTGQNVSEIYSNGSEIESVFNDNPVSIKIDGVPQLYDTLNGKIAYYMNNEVCVINPDFTIRSKIAVNNNVTALKFVKNAKILAIVYKDRIDFVKL